MQEKLHVPTSHWATVVSFPRNTADSVLWPLKPWSEDVQFVPTTVTYGCLYAAEYNLHRDWSKYVEAKFRHQAPEVIIISTGPFTK